jgi:hypothetical protein
MSTDILTNSRKLVLCLSTYSQGGVQFPTGGIPGSPGSPRALLPSRKEVSRSGERPGPTVTVRMEEDRAVNTYRTHSHGVSPTIACWDTTVFPCALILVNQLK